ncbi:hypothetical protein EG68_10692 [Paragonimus skrjabini miyazakii]|uniref:GTP:AMP phosphotransferase, mitochondrial n=1 Tax=Paragonimus skrjabini miyazakii TaxID=59628 RepID=A0A8S9YGJ6_9TREM|nr:hypothetical protein EG68_10692 [Paragonimus skrjabini miyazakii]
MRLSRSLCSTVKAIILGPPGSGKGTISNRLKKDFPLTWLSSGDLLRTHVADNTTIGLTASSYMNKGLFVPDEVVTKMMLTECEKYRDSHLLLDGFPRTVAQAKALDNELVIACVLNLDVPFDEIINRIKCRWVHLPSGRIYNTEFNPPKKPGIDDITGEALIQRKDDQPDAVRTRLETYQRSMQALFDYYKSKNLLHNFRGRYSNELWPQVHKAFSEYLKPLQYTEYK